MSDEQIVRVLFVCLGNICRSPTAAGFFKVAVDGAGLGARIEIDSAGTGPWHVGEPADRRAAAAALGRGVDLSAHRARQVERDDFEEFHHLVAMDRDNYDDLLAMSPAGKEERVSLFLSHAASLDSIEVPDPFYGGAAGFERMIDLISEASAGLLAEIRAGLAGR